MRVSFVPGEKRRNVHFPSSFRKEEEGKREKRGLLHSPRSTGKAKVDCKKKGERSLPLSARRWEEGEMPNVVLPLTSQGKGKRQIVVREERKKTFLRAGRGKKEGIV